MQGSGGATPGAVWALCDRMGYQGTPLPGGLLPPGPPANTIGAGTGKPRRHVHPAFSHRKMLGPPPPCMSGVIRPNRVQPPGRGACRVSVREIWFCLSRGAAAPRSPGEGDKGRDGQTSAACPSIIFHRPVRRLGLPRISRAIVCGGPGCNPRCGDGGVCVYG